MRAAAPSAPLTSFFPAGVLIIARTASRSPSFAAVASDMSACAAPAINGKPITLASSMALIFIVVPSCSDRVRSGLIPQNFEASPLALRSPLAHGDRCYERHQILATVVRPSGNASFPLL